MSQATRHRALWVLLVLAALPTAVRAQTYTFTQYWTIDATGTPVVAPQVIDLRQATGFAARLRMTVLYSAVAWNNVTFAATAPVPLWTGADALASNGTPGCGVYANTTGCLDLANTGPGVYLVDATTSGGGTGTGLIVIGGGAAAAVAGPQDFTLAGEATALPFQYALSLGDAFPVMQTGSFTPGNAPAGMALELAALLDALPGFTASAAGATITVDTVPPGLPFRFWIDDFQVTGGAGQFNPGIEDVTIAALPVEHQPGPNFPTAAAQFGTGRSEALDVGDVDRDGDLDVVVANGGDGFIQANRIYINEGGLQGGIQGTFSDSTAARFAGVPDDTSRHIELADIDGDFDLDVQVSNRGTIANGGEPSRSYRNLGGLQGGTLGFFTEDTNTTWGTLVSVPAVDQVLGGNQGPFRDYSCDCEFGDLDLDGDLDLFHSSYGPSLFGTRDSRVFLNDGTGTFDELWPWADPAADIQLHTIDVDLVDLDGDFDLDVVTASRNSQARIYRNDLSAATGSWPSDPFTDITQTALLDTGATVFGSSHYETETGDLDGDGDFDLWMVNYFNFRDRILRNQGDLTFALETDWIRGDPDQDEQDTEFLDYDGDGDLDAFLANFSGTNHLFQSGLAEALDPDVSGLYHRTGTSSGGSLAPWAETPATNNGGTTLSATSGDLDGDGDPDLLLANDSNQSNRLWENALGIPDSHGPTVPLLTIQGDKADGSDTVIRARLQDNAPMHAVGRYQVDLLYRVDGGPINRVAMASQGGQQFQATIPGGIHGPITYWVEAHDQARNMGVSQLVSYVQTSSGTTLRRIEGEGTPGLFRRPRLTVDGTLLGNSPVTALLRDAAPLASSVWFFSAASTPLPFKGGLLHTIPVLLTVNLPTNASGQLLVPATWPPGLPAGLDLWTQFGVSDAAAQGGASLTNAVRLTTP